MGGIRHDWGYWCNNKGAGLGQRPTVDPKAGIDAYYWVKPPGESDGSSTLIPNNEGKGFDQMCDPAYTGNARNGNNKSGAMSGAPSLHGSRRERFRSPLRGLWKGGGKPGPPCPHG